ncbi:MAG: NfeD family protein [Bacteroidales bacterium]|nr:NfeD family protein [Bacteroidales bacterium]
MEAYHILIVIGILLFIAEIFLPGFIAGSLAIGAFLAALASFLGLGVKWQILIFSLGVLVTFFTIRPLMIKSERRSGGKIKTNQEALIGRTGKVVETIDNHENTGRISIDGDVWRSKSTDDSVIQEGTNVEIIGITSIILMVKPLK